MPPPEGAPAAAARRRAALAGNAIGAVLLSPAGRHGLLGLLGAACLTLGGFAAGAKPRTGSYFDWNHLSGATSGLTQGISTWLVWVGVLVMVLAWVRLGRAVLAGGVSLGSARWTVALWVAPMLLALPMFSRDAYAYLAQGALLRDGFDPYVVGPAADPGPLTRSVSPVWRSTTAPYGPAFLLLARGITTVTGDHVALGTYVMRLALLPGLVLMVWALPRIARRLGGDPVLAVWLGVLNPLVLVHLVAGTHNDLPMLGLLLAGLLLVLERRHLPGVAVITLALAVKATAVVALPFVVWIWMAHERERARSDGRPEPHRWPLFLRTTGAGLVVGAAVFAALSLAAGVGLGWITALSGSSQTVNWLSLPSAVAQLVTGVALWFAPLSLTNVLPVSRTVGAVLLVALLLAIWFRARPRGRPAVWSPRPPHRRTSGDVQTAVRGIVAALVVLVLLSPVALPWYYSWSLAVAAGLALSRRTLVLVVGLSTWLMLVYQPAGDTALYIWPQVLGAVAAGLLAAWLLVRDMAQDVAQGVTHDRHL